jgi:myo-inositol-1(or 4)-monophosphatase
MTDPIDARHALACQIARDAGAAALAFFEARDALVIEAKATPQDVVSRADREVEALVRAAITADFPDDGIIGEEDAPKPGSSGFTWVIDPIDGTMPFLSGLPHWCVAIALVEGDRTVAAATFAPVLGHLFDARLGAGFRRNSTPHRVSGTLELTGAMTAIGVSHRAPASEAAAILLRLMEAGGVFYRTGSGALMLAEVASGGLAGYFEPHMNAWDCLGGLLMVQEAGGMTGGFDMATMLASGGRVLAAAPRVYEPFARICEG